MPQSIDVVVPTFNRWDLTEACLGDLAGQTVEHAVIVSDDGSTDGTPARVREAFPVASVVEADRRRGLPAGSLAGARRTGRDDGLLPRGSRSRSAATRGGLEGGGRAGRRCDASRLRDRGLPDRADPIQQRLLPRLPAAALRRPGHS